MEANEINVGDKFGKWTIIEIKGRSGGKAFCSCECGIIKCIARSILIRKESLGCASCSHKKNKLPINTKIGKWFLIAEVKGKYGNVSYQCRCDCGAIRIIPTYKGTLRTNCCYECNKPTFKHGGSKHPLYVTYKDMISRCFNEKSKAFKDYGGRGITVCESWLNSFDKFLKDMGPRPEGTSIDRIDVDGDYEPSNCRWATTKEQSANRRNSIKNKNRFIYIGYISKDRITEDFINNLIQQLNPYLKEANLKQLSLF